MPALVKGREVPEWKVKIVREIAEQLETTSLFS